MTQQTWNRRGALAAGSATLAAAQARGAPALARPNILWLVSEDNNPFIGAYGDTLAHTPTIDALAKVGVRYANAFSSAPVCAPTRFSILTGLYAETCGPAHHMRAKAEVPPAFRTYPELLRAAGYHCTNNAKTDYNCTLDPAKLWDESSASAHWRGRALGQPFMAVFNHETTHESQIFRRTEGRVTPDQVRVPVYLPDDPDIRADYASYYNLMEKMDGQLAARLAELKADGLAEDTIVFYYSDNGGVMPRSKRYCYDEGLRCALIVYAPPKWAHLLPAAPGSVIEAPVTHVDLGPTMLSVANLPKPAQMQGRAFLGPRAGPPQIYAFGMRGRMDERYDFVRTVTDGRWRYIRNYQPHRIWGVHGSYQWQAKGYQAWERAYLAGRLNAVQARYFGTKPYEELYDLTRDPDQVQNLAGAPAQRTRQRAFARALDRHMLETRDNGFIPEGMAPEGYHASRNPVAYPLAKVMALADAAARRDPASLGAFRSGLSETNAVLRYWAAMGLLILGAEAAPATAALDKLMREDPMPQIRLVAAEAVAGLRPGSDAIATLGTLTRAPLIWPVRLQALNALTALGQAARPALADIEACQTADQEYLRSASRYLAQVLNGTYAPGT